MPLSKFSTVLQRVNEEEEFDLKCLSSESITMKKDDPIPDEG
jgi:hypothetical protein